MRLELLAAALLPLLASAEYTTSSSSSSSRTTITSTATLTKTITVSQVVASVYSTYPAHNRTISASGPTVASASYTPLATGTGSASPIASATSTNTHFISAASSFNAYWAGSAGLVVCAVAAML